MFLGLVVGDGNRFDLLGSRYPLVLDAGHPAAVQRRHDGGNQHSQIQGDLGRPLARSLLARFVQDQVHQGLFRLVIGDRENFGGELDQERIQDALVPFVENVGQLGGGQPQHLTQNVVGLRDELHIAVFDSIVNHLHEMTGSVGAAMGHAGTRVGLGRDGLENRLHKLISLLTAAGHDGGAKTSAFLAPRDAGAEEVKTFLGQLGLAALGVFEPRIAAVDDDVALGQKGLEDFNGVIHRVAGLHHQHDAAGGLERINEIFQGMGADKFFALVHFHERRHAVAPKVDDRHRKAVVLNVHGQVRAHDGDSKDTKIGLFHLCCGCHRSILHKIKGALIFGGAF